MDAFTYSNTTTIHFGPDQIQQLSNEIPTDAKVLLCYGGGSVKKNGVYDQVVAALKQHQWGEFAGIEPNPQYDTLMKAVEQVRAEQYDYILAVGGGSVIDGCKFIAIAAPFAGDPWTILSEQVQGSEAVPMGCVLTLPATGSETNIGSVVSRGSDKLYFFSPLVRPRFAVLDPTTTLSLSQRQVSNGVVDAYVHTLEQYLTFSTNAKVQDRFAEGLLHTLIEEGPKALSTPDDIDVRSNIMWAATQALNGLIGSGVPQDWSTHMIGHELTALFGVDHARSLSIVLPAVMRQRRAQKEAKLLQYGERIFGITEGSTDERIDATIEATVAFFKQMEMPVSLSDAEIAEDEIDNIIANLEAHGRTALGEHGDIAIDESREILLLAR